MCKYQVYTNAQTIRLGKNRPVPCSHNTSSELISLTHGD